MNVITEKEVEKMKILLEEGLSYRAIQIETGISIATISKIKNNKFLRGTTYIEIANKLNKVEQENNLLKEEIKVLKLKITELENIQHSKKRGFFKNK